MYFCPPYHAVKFIHQLQDTIETMQWTYGKGEKMAQRRETLLKIQATQGSVQISSSLTTVLEVAMELTSARDGFWYQNVNVHWRKRMNLKIIE